MIYLNGKEVEFINLPNKERRLDLPKDMVTTDIYEDVDNVYWKYEDDKSIFELLLLDSAIKSYDAKYNLYIGYMPYSRMDRTENEGTAFSLDVMTTILTQNLLALNYLFVLDPHSEITLKQLNEKSKPKCERYEYEFASEFEYLKDEDDDEYEDTQIYSLAKDVFNYTKVNLNSSWIVFPDKGAAKSYNTSDYPNVIVCDKVRDFATGKVQTITAHIEKQTFTPQKDAPIIIIDDLCSYGGTFVGVIKAIEKDLNIKSENNWLIVSHVEEAMMVADIPKNIQKVFSTDSIATPPEAISMSNHKFDDKHQFYVRPVLDIIAELNK